MCGETPPMKILRLILYRYEGNIATRFFEIVGVRKKKSALPRTPETDRLAKRGRKGYDVLERREERPMSKELWQLLGLYLLAVNAAAFLVMGADKRRARRGDWRISEKALFLPAVLGGALGGLIGMQIFRHKTKHWYFRWGYPLLLALQLAGALWLAAHGQT